MADKWTEDDEIYIEYYVYDEETKNLDDAEKFLNRSKGAIKTKLYKMRKIDDKVEYISRPWSEKDVEYLKRNYKFIPTELMASHLRRSRDAIIAKATKLGVYKLARIENYDEEIREMAKQGMYKAEIARNLGLKPKSVGEYINRNNIPCKKAPKSASQKHFRDEDELRWMNYNELKKGYKPWKKK